MSAIYDQFVRVEPCDALPDPAHPGLANRGKWERVRERLRAVPGQWFLVLAIPKEADADRKLSTTASLGMAPKAQGFETAIRTVGDERRVYARFVGKAETQPTG